MALLFSLGILAILLVLGLVFATTAMVDQKVAKSYNDTVRARLIAHSAVQRTLMMLKYNQDGKAVLASPKDQWHYISADINGDTQYIGRFRYDRNVAGPRLDPSASVAHVAGAAYNENTIDEHRPGVALEEVNLRNLGGIIDATTLSNNNAGGSLPIGMRWPDYDTMFTALGVPLILTDAANIQYRKWFTVGDPADPEAFWIDGGASDKSTEMYHRFDLARTNVAPYAAPTTHWDSLDVNDIIKLAQLYSVAYDGSGGIPWLKNYLAVDGGALEAATFASPDNRAKQIAANLIDYCDANDEPTADPAPGAWAAGTTPDYTGNEKTPYINEITAEVEASVTKVGGPNAGTFTYTYSVSIDIGAEVVNIYDVPLPAAGSCKVKLYGVLDIQVHGGVESFTLESTEIDFGIVPANSYVHQNLTLNIATSGFNNQNDALQDVVVKKLTLHTAIMSCNGLNVDYSTVHDGSNVITDQVLLASGAADATSEWVNCAWEVNDPRQNLFQADWTFHPAVLHQDFATITTMANQNKAATFAADGDAEAASTVATLSTNYIRNAPMQSPWELGCIHRGAKWETINLKKYNSTGKNKGGIGKYEDGDANILDQVKMTSDTTVYGKVNMNINDPNGTTGAQDVLRTLFTNIWINKNYDDPGHKSGSQMTTAKADILAAAMITYGNSNPIPDYRAAILGVTQFTDDSLGLTQTTDATKEAIIGKLINLTKAAPLGVDSDTIIAQTLKDVGKPGGGSMPVVKQVFEGGTWKTKTENAKYEQYDEYSDEILSEVKVNVEFWLSPITGKWRIKSYAFPED